MDPRERSPIPPGRLLPWLLPGLLPWLLLLAPAALAWPSPALLRDDPFPHLAGTGIVALAALPAALVLPFHPGGPTRGLRLLAALIVFLAIAVLVGRPGDAVEARRALVLAGTWAVLFTGGSLLAGDGLRVFVRGLVVLSLAWTGVALGGAVASGDGALAGVLGDTGSLSQAALPGAAAAAWIVAARGRFFAPACIAVGAFLLHAGLAPVLAGVAAFFAVLALGAFAGSGAPPAARRAMAILAVLAIAALAVPRALDRPPAPEGPASAGPGVAGDLGGSEERARTSWIAENLGGFEVRGRIWGRLPALVRDHALFGVGPGQFQASFPPYRDPREIELSRHGVCSDATTEVEHAHDDFLEGLAELGLLGGAMWALFLLLAARAGWLALRERGPVTTETGAAGIAVLALLANALVHAPLLFNPAASAIGFVLFGALRARARAQRLVGRPVLGLVAGAGIASALLGWPLVEHGRALVDYIRTSRALREAGASTADPGRILDEARRAVGRALDAAPSSAPARLLAARLADRDAEAAWSAALEVRPHAVEALEALGLLYARTGDVGRARERWEQALRLSPTAPRLLRNLARLELLDGDARAGRDHLARLDRAGCTDPAWREGLGVDLVLHGRWDPGAELLLGHDLAALDPQEVHATAGELDDEDPRRSALRCLAHLAWARAQLASGEDATAVRSYRQVLLPTRRVDGAGAAPARVELAAAEVAVGRTEEARRRVEGLAFEPRLWEALPARAKELLRDAGLYAER